MEVSKAAILSIGSEILEGRILNTNAQWLSKELSSLGFKVTGSASCNDVNSEIIEASKFLLKQADVLITTGGLGPTSDDITRQAIADLVDSPLVKSEKALSQIKAYFARRDREMKDSNIQQAMLPEGALVIENSAGTAPGFYFSKDNRHILVLPGPPREMKTMYEADVKNLLQTSGFKLQAPYEQVLRIFGIGEFTLGEILSAVDIPESVEVAYRFHFPEVQLLFKSLNKSDSENACLNAKEAIGTKAIFSESSEKSLPAVAHDLLIKHKKTISLAESCTGGLVTKLLTDIPGSSEYLVAGSATYANEAKTKLLGVSEEILKEKGAVNFEIAEQMARGSREFFNTDYGLSITGIAGPTGGTEEKPVGTFYLGISTKAQTEAFKCFFPGARETVRIYSAHIALDLLRRKLLGYEPHSILEMKAC